MSRNSMQFFIFSKPICTLSTLVLTSQLLNILQYLAASTQLKRNEILPLK